MLKSKCRKISFGPIGSYSSQSGISSLRCFIALQAQVEIVYKLSSREPNHLWPGVNFRNLA